MLKAYSIDLRRSMACAARPEDLNFESGASIVTGNLWKIIALLQQENNLGK